MADLHSAVEPMNDPVTRIERLENDREIGSIVIRPDYITQILVNLDMPNGIVNIMKGLYETVVELEVNAEALEYHGHQVPLLGSGARRKE